MAPAPAVQEALEALGVRRVEAALVAYLHDVPQATTQEIVEATGLRQPEVSTGMRALKARAWIRTEAVPAEGKGRPMHRHVLTTDWRRIHDHYRAVGARTIAMAQEALGRLDRAMAASS